MPNNDCSFVVDACFNGGALRSFNWMRRYKDYPRAILPKIPEIYKSAARRLKFVCGDQELRGSGDAIISPIRDGGQFRPVRVRLIGGDAGLLLRMDIIGKLCIAVDFRKRNAHIGNGVWKAMARNGEDRWVFHLSPNASGYTKLGTYFRENGKFRFMSLSGTSGFRGNFGCNGSFCTETRQKGPIE